MQEVSNSILEMAQGAITVQVNVEVGKVMQNILDPNTNATKLRSVTIKVDFKPSDDRSQVVITATASSKLLPNNAIQTSLYVGSNSDGEILATELVPNIPGQIGINDEVQESPKIIKIAM